ncbi:hypothetical protein [Paludibacterium denitrificans]|uniref:Phage protein n=1 Tax=Paludibacterium denitrificans TaxID=2675226 RepID=A0A844GHQ5_9NEIS|nr:hypothetical protein [Paludibacterium denitrificans]MTD34025.1 hypothetical protein [Paludibacterium denitrificans]
MSIAKTLQNMVRKRGTKLTVTHTTASAFDPATGGVTQTTQSSTAKGIVSAVNTREVNGTTIQLGDKKVRFYAPDLSFEPVPNDSVTIGGQPWNVSDVLPTWEGDSAVSYLLIVRR